MSKACENGAHSIHTPNALILRDGQNLPHNESPLLTVALQSLSAMRKVIELMSNSNQNIH